ncbi:putative transcriptional regulator [Prescottella equi 103S]|uniref:Transcriptional regulator n=1 Tax=Rhodococcus hoagii (strain 103S) TaxID=685727 RepID=A0A3S5YDB6_RHOH1|nr:Rrf2 family transcriptional regulator [Prescottella equi]CBH50573.1 putative transcriptional regulator [Prescottella equi 103S]
MTWIGLYQRRGHEVTTSEQIATSVNTNPVVIRRLLSELRKAGLADSRRGRAGRSRGTWRRSPARRLPGDRTGTGLRPASRDTDPECVVGHGSGPAMTAVFDDVEAALRRELAKTTLEDVLRDALKAA